VLLYGILLCVILFICPYDVLIGVLIWVLICVVLLVGLDNYCILLDPVHVVLLLFPYDFCRFWPLWDPVLCALLVFLMVL